MNTIDLPVGLRVGLESAGVPMTPEEFDAVIAECEIYRSPLLPGFELPLARLLAAADKWK